jgi:cyclopropane fatty-acyl-phospholipid synthase-like methyltransferase
MPTLNDAELYVATDKVSGLLQLNLLKQLGCLPPSKVLEIGCGCLHLGIPLISYLNKSNYVGIDPNDWLRSFALEDHRQLIAEKNPRFLSVSDFDASWLGIKFDFVFSHSVLSHCAYWQLDQFLMNSAKVLARTGCILASIRLAEGNEYGSLGSPDKKDTREGVWQYPRTTYFTFNTVFTVANKYGLSATHKPEYTKYYIKERPKEYHDWILFSR